MIITTRICRVDTQQHTMARYLSAFVFVRNEVSRALNGPLDVTHYQRTNVSCVDYSHIIKHDLLLLMC